MGQLYSLALRQGGQQVSILHHQAVSIETLRAGIQAEFQGLSIQQRVPVGTDPSILDGCQVVLVCLKAYQAVSAARGIAEWLEAGHSFGFPLFVSLMNGLHAEAPFTTYLGAYTVSAGVSYAGARRLGAGQMTGASRLQIAGYGPTYLPRMSGQANQTLADLADVLTAAGLPAVQQDNIGATVWTKAIVNSVINPLAALAGIPNGQLPATAVFKRSAPRIIAEAVAVARQAGVLLEAGALLESCIKTCQTTAANRCSMLSDLEAGRPSEINWLNGAIAAQAESYGLAAPVNRRLTARIQARERRNQTAD